MEPSARTEPVLQLPQPVMEYAPVNLPGYGHSEHAARPEAGPSLAPPSVPPIALPQDNTAQQQSAVLPMPIADPTLIAAPVASSSVTPTQQTEKQIDELWVSKAKKIVEQTHTDPFIESQELGKTKVAYLKARYNKEIKPVEG